MLLPCNYKRDAGLKCYCRSRREVQERMELLRDAALLLIWSMAEALLLVSSSSRQLAGLGAHVARNVVHVDFVHKLVTATIHCESRL